MDRPANGRVTRLDEFSIKGDAPIIAQCMKLANKANHYTSEAKQLGRLVLKNSE
jgi:hypothetical protein